MVKSVKKLLVVMIISVFMISIVTATAYAVGTPIEKKNTDDVKIESKSKTVNYKITWNANGGKIGSKKTVSTTVKKGTKINKLITSPKRSGYTFKGWYSKKTGGTKISKNTIPVKSVSYFAQWKKANSSLNAVEKKLLGTWTRKYTVLNTREYIFTHSKDKTYTYTYVLTTVDNRGRVSVDKSYYKGLWRASGNTLYYTNIKKLSYDGKTWLPVDSQTNKITFAQDVKGQYYGVGDVANNVKFYKVV